jgi:hypothetical protein
MAGPDSFPRWIADVEETLVAFLTELCQDYFENLPIGSKKGQAYRYGGEFERGIEALSPVLPAILVRYDRSDFDAIDETQETLERKAQFEFFYVFWSARSEAEAREGCTQVMERVVQELTGKSFEGAEITAPYRECVTGTFRPIFEEFFFGERGLVVYRQLWETSRVE